MKQHFLQSPAWEKFQKSLGRETLRKSGDDWSYLAIAEHGRFANRLYCPYGPTVADAKNLAAALDDLYAEASRRKMDFIRIEPVGDVAESDLIKLKLRRSHHNIQPADTAVADVSIDADQIVARAASNTRNLWRKNQRSGVVFDTSYDPNDIDDFLRLIHKTAARTGMKPMPDSYFRSIAKTLFPMKSAGLMRAILDEKVIATLIFYTDGQTMYYAHAAADDDFRKLSPATALLMNAQIFTHEQGCKVFDFFGIAPENADSNNPWIGFTKFKLSFGGQRLTRLGTWELPLRKNRYRLYKLLLKLTGKS